ncbi:MAG: DUF2796 domain-containing protein [Cocleimonas sp.]|nr:DUF2796 domain-containing protein [Cocleimonas sp.]
MKTTHMTLFPKLLTITPLIIGSLLLHQSVIAKGLNGPHKHGELELTVLKADGQVIFNLVAPAQDIAGYEHAPTSEANKTAAINAEKSLYTVDNLNVLFDFSPKNVCQPFESYVNADLLNIHTHEKKKGQSFISMLAEKDHPTKPEDDVHVVGVGGHSDYVMSYVFDCGEVESVTLGFAKQFPSIKKINLREKNLEGKVVKTFTSNGKATIDFNKL